MSEDIRRTARAVLAEWDAARPELRPREVSAKVEGVVVTVTVGPSDLEKKLEELRAALDAEYPEDNMPICECCGEAWTSSHGKRHGQTLCEDCIFSHDRGDFDCGCDGPCTCKPWALGVVHGITCPVRDSVDPS